MSNVINLESLSDRDLMTLHAATIDTLMKRGVVRTRNQPIGDYAEFLVVTAFGGRLAPNSTKGFDIETTDGRRWQVKSRQVIDPTRRAQRQLSGVRSLEFDELAVVLFGHDYGVYRAVLIPREVFQDNARYIAHTNSRRVYAHDDLLDDHRCSDITDQIRRVQSQPRVVAAGDGSPPK